MEEVLYWSACGEREELEISGWLTELLQIVRGKSTGPGFT